MKTNSININSFTKATRRRQGSNLQLLQFYILQKCREALKIHLDDSSEFMLNDSLKRKGFKIMETRQKSEPWKLGNFDLEFGMLSNPKTK